MTSPLFLHGLSQASDMLVASRVERQTPGTMSKQASLLFPVTGKGALIGGLIGAAIGGLRHAGRAKAILGTGRVARANQAAARATHKGAVAKGVANPKYVRTAQEVQAERDLRLLGKSKAPIGPRGVRSPLERSIRLHAPGVAAQTASWGAGGAALGHAAEAGFQKYRKGVATSTAKKWALPALGGLVAYKTLTA